MSNFKGVTTVDLYLTVPVAMARIGGFILGWVVVTYLVLFGWNYFNANHAVITTLYTFSGRDYMLQSLDPRLKSTQIIKDTRKFTYSFCHYLCPCLCLSKRAIWKEARKSMD